MITTILIALVVLYIFFTLLKWSFKLFFLLLLIMVGIGIYHKINPVEKMSEIGHYLENKISSSHEKQEKI